MKKVSVIIPTYKRSDYLIRAINSVLNQTYKNIEIIVVDDNGIGNKFQLENEKKLSKYVYEKKIIYLKHNINKNGAAARNSGLRVATGDFITFLDDDDFFLKQRVELLVKKLEDNQYFDAVYSSMVKIKNNHIYNYRVGNKTGNLLKEILSQYSFFGTGSNMFFTKKAIEKIGEFDENFFRFQDLEYMARFFEKKFNICSVKNVLVVKCEEDTINIPNYEKMKLAKEMFSNKFSDSIKKINFKNIMYCIYKELYIFSSGSNHKEAYKLLKEYDKLKIKDFLIFLYNRATLKFKIFKYLNFKVREIRCIGKYTFAEKEEIYSIINLNNRKEK